MRSTTYVFPIDRKKIKCNLAIIKLPKIMRAVQHNAFPIDNIFLSLQMIQKQTNLQMRL